MVSLSARRAWIEIDIDDKFGGLMSSLSARRAWIEMLASRLIDMSAAVALRKESVDRNFMGPLIFSVQARRSPQGERG